MKPIFCCRFSRLARVRSAAIVSAGVSSMNSGSVAYPISLAQCDKGVGLFWCSANQKQGKKNDSDAHEASYNEPWQFSTVFELCGQEADRRIVVHSQPQRKSLS